MTKTAEADLNRDVSFSPLKRFQAEHCQACRSNCDPAEKRFLACLLSALVNSTERQQPKQCKGSKGRIEGP